MWNHLIPSAILGIEPDKHLNGVFRHIAENARSFTRNKTLDLVIYDNKRLFRIPATMHESTNLYKIPITEEELRNATHEHIKNLATNKRVITFIEPRFNNNASTEYKKALQEFYKNKDKKPVYNITGTLKCTPPCIQFLIDNGAVDGSRNNSIAALASFHKNKGTEFESTLEILSTWNEKLNTPPTKQAEVTRTVRSIYSGKASYGCTTLKQILECNENDCPLKKKGRSK